MERLNLSGNTLSVRKGAGRPINFELDKLRLAFLVTSVKETWFIIAGGSDLATVDMDDGENQEALNLVHEEFRKAKPGRLSGFDICLADYGTNRCIITLKSFKKNGVDIFQALENTRNERVGARKEWLADDPTVMLKGRFSTAGLSRDGFALSDKKKLAWDDVGQIQIDKQESLITTTHLLLIPEGVGTGMFSFRKYKYALKWIPNRMANLYLAECAYWRN